MLGFTIKKAFFDFWDNLFLIIILNFGFLLLAGVPVFFPYWVYSLHPVLSLAVFFAGILLLFVYAGAVSHIARDISDYRHPGLSEFLSCLKKSRPAGLSFGIITTVLIAFLMIAFPVYGAMNNFFGLAAMIFIFWAGVLWILAGQYFFPLRSRFDDGLVKAVKKCFLLLFDNTAFTVFLGIGSVTLITLSAFTAFLIPGPAAVLIWLQTGLKLRLLKYDYLDAHPGADRRNIPWDTLLVEEQEMVGKRTLKGMIFPWKE